MSPAAGDINGDGFEDLVVGARDSNVGGLIDAGEAFVYWGPGYTVSTTLTDLVPEANARFGHWVDCGDFDGDGYDDVAISAPWASVAGMPKVGSVTVFYGPSLGPAATFPNPFPQGEDRFGYRVCAEDLDLDGFCDLAVAHPFRWSSPTANDKVGAVSVLFGPFFSNTILIPNPTPTTNALMGADLAVADLDDDGFADLVIGAEFDAAGGLVGQGSVIVSNGPGFTTTTHVYSPAPTTDAGFGGGVDVGDFNGDDQLDIFVSEFYYDTSGVLNAGRCHVLLGPSFAGGYVFEEPVKSVNAQFGRRVRAGDLDGDGCDEIIIGVPQSNGSGVGKAGAIYIGTLQ